MPETKKKEHRMLVQVHKSWDSYSVKFMINGSSTDLYPMVTDACHYQFEEQTGIRLDVGETRVFRLAAVKQRRRTGR